MQGRLDETVIWSRALSDQEVAVLAGGGRLTALGDTKGGVDDADLNNVFSGYRSTNPNERARTSFNSHTRARSSTRHPPPLIANPRRTPPTATHTGPWLASVAGSCTDARRVAIRAIARLRLEINLGHAIRV